MNTRRTSAAARARPVVFLDLDGVLTTMSTRYRTGDPLCVARLNRITDATGAAIVVSSTWRHAPDIASILAGWGVTGQLIGITPDCSRYVQGQFYSATERGYEIDRWQVNNKFAGEYVILDDENDMCHLIDHLVQTDTLLGLRDEDVERAIELLAAHERAAQRLRGGAVTR